MPKFAHKSSNLNYFYKSNQETIKKIERKLNRVKHLSNAISPISKPLFMV